MRVSRKRRGIPRESASLECNVIRMRVSIFVLALAAMAPAVSSPLSAQSCHGDCDLDCSVSVDELLTLVTAALDETQLVRCRAGDADGDGEVTVDELLGAVVNGLQGCENELCTEPSVPATFAARPGVEQLTVTGAPPQTALTLYDASGTARVSFITDAWGQTSFNYVPSEYGVFETGPGVGVPTTDGVTIKRGYYLIRNETVDPPQALAKLWVRGVDDVANEGFYASQSLQPGFQYIEMRDGVKLSATVRFPEPALWGAPPYPTVIEYSGYATSNPNSQDPGSSIANLLGYATVGVNMRGSGCSGGVFDIFNPAQQADGYDIVEVVARQPWVLHGKVGMVGLSYAGIAQLFVASTRPPSLAAITSLSVIDDPWRQQWPGGVYNSGFTREWLAERDRAQSPSGSSWVAQRIEGGDELCAEHQPLRNQNPDFEQFGRALETFVPDNDARRLGLLVRQIEVPVFLTGAWQDEQTGSRFATLLDEFTATEMKRFITFNGRHPDGYSPLSLLRWWEFLELFVARRTPWLNPLFATLASGELSSQFRVPGLTLEPTRFPRGMPYLEALALYETEARVRVLFEVGGDHPTPNAPVARFEQSFASWPPPEAQPRIWHLGPAGSLLDEPSAEAGIDRYLHDADAGAVSYSTTSAFAFIYPDIQFAWPAPQPATALSYLSEPLEEDVVVVGNGGYVQLWFASEATVANVEVTITDVRADGTETIVQSGVFDVAHRNGILEDESDTFLVEYTYSASDLAPPLVPGEFVEVKVPIRPFAHPFRAGSRLRLIIDTPGRDSPLWKYENPAYEGEVWHSVARTPERVSFLLLPVVPGIAVPEEIPACNSLRGQICREYEPFVNETVEP